MDEEDTAAYTEPCAQCSEVDWGVSPEGRFYCRTCHNVIERSREVVDPTLDRGAHRVSRLNKGPRSKRAESGHLWMVCEAFQFILQNQADALLSLGVHPQFKDLVLCPMWRLYLQRSRQAFTERPVRSSRGGVDSDSDSVDVSSGWSMSATEEESNPPSVVGSQAETGRGWSGSVDAATYLQTRRNRSRGLLTMRKTLALIHLALVWSREALTLSDLLRLVTDGQVPYVNAYEGLPDQMKVSGRDAVLFTVESVPSYQRVHEDSQDLVQFLQLPAFPPIDRDTPLHPAPLSLRYLTDANLPDELHPWVCGLMERAGMADQTLHTFDPASHPVLPPHDLQAAALILVTMKVLFGLDDLTEWDLSNQVQDASGGTFTLRRWYRLLEAALARARLRQDRTMARKQWKSKKPIIRKRTDGSWVVKRKRIAEQMQACFQRLSSRPGGIGDPGPSSFRFRWGDVDGSDGPSMHDMKLGSVLTLKGGVQIPSNGSYWHPALQPCYHGRGTATHFLSQVASSLPSSFSWLLQLFSFMLHVTADLLLQEALQVERRLFGSKTPCHNQPEKTGTRTGTRTGTGTGTSQKSGGSEET